MGEVWLKQGDHFAVKRFNDRDDIGVLYLPEGSQMVRSGDLIVRDEFGIFRLGDCEQHDSAKEVDYALDLSAFSPDQISDTAQAEFDSEHSANARESCDQHAIAKH